VRSTPLPSLAPTPLPTPARVSHKCAGKALAYSTKECQLWWRTETWTSNSLPVVGDIVEIKAPASPDGAEDGAACVSVNVDDAVASRVVVKPSLDGSGARLRVGSGGRLVVSGTVTAADGPECNYPSPSPTITFEPSAPSATPTHLPTTNPSPLPSSGPTPVPVPTAAPSPHPYGHDCGAVVSRVFDQGLTCAAAWDDGASWLGGSAPQRGDLVQLLDEYRSTFAGPLGLSRLVDLAGGGADAAATAAAKAGGEALYGALFDAIEAGGGGNAGGEAIRVEALEAFLLAAAQPPPATAPLQAPLQEP